MAHQACTTNIFKLIWLKLTFLFLMKKLILFISLFLSISSFANSNDLGVFSTVKQEIGMMCISSTTEENFNEAETDCVSFIEREDFERLLEFTDKQYKKNDV